MKVVQTPVEEYRVGCDIGKDDRAVIVSETKKIWKHYAVQDVEELNDIIRNASNFMIAQYFRGYVSGFVRAIGANTGGNPYNIADTAHELTGNRWSKHIEDGDSVILVDATIFEAYQGLKLSKPLINYALELFRDRYRFTYSPTHAVDLHVSNGAELVRKIEKARPGLILTRNGCEFLTENVHVTQYS